MGKTRQPLAILVSDWQKLRKSLKLEVQMIIVYIRGSENLHQLSENKEFIMYTQLPNVVY
jgi:hypothetical protein